MKRFIFLALILSFCFASAQNTMYFMDRLPQNLTYNPAIVPEMNFYLGLPAVGGISAQAYNSGFTYNQLKKFTDNLADLKYNPDDFVKSIGDYNIFTGELEMNLLSFGFKVKEKGYFSFLAKMNNLVINKAASDIAYVVADVNNLFPEDFPVIVKDITLTANSYFNIGFTYAHKINEQLTLGISPRVNFNQAGLKTSGLSYRVDYNEETPGSPDYNQTFSGEVQLALPAAMNPEAVDKNGELVFDAGLLSDDWLENTNLNRILKDKSLAFDIGAVYQAGKWIFSASMLNIGASTYKTDAYILSGNNDKILVKKAEKLTVDIPLRIYAGAARQFTQKWNYAVLINNNFYNYGSVFSATASLNGHISNTLSTSVSYTAGYKYDNLGIGLRFRFFPGTDLYFVTDNILQAFSYKNAYRFTASAGINISVGFKDKELQPADDLPVETK